tara:strand:+ start:165 stop:719 length:555 start_codon:yes stop_codon:yes gene_type:complete
LNLYTERALITALQAGDVTAYEQLVSTHLQPINHYIRRMLGYQANETDDLTQEVFLKLWHKSSQFNPDKAKLTTWLHQLARNLCIDHFRRNKNWHLLDPEDAEPVAESETEPDSLLGSLRSAEHIQAAIQSLPERQRSALILCHYQGLSNKQAADIPDTSVEALESLLSRARSNLKQRLAVTST